MLEILKQYAINHFSIQPLGNGLINSTWLVDAVNKKYVLQKINSHVFKLPEAIAYNISLISKYLTKKNPTYLFTSPVKTLNNDEFVISNGEHYRLFKYIDNSHTIDVVSEVGQAFEAAKQFALFTKELNQFDASQLKTTIPDFHNLTLRFTQFEKALFDGNKERIIEATELILYIQQQKSIVDEFEFRKINFKTRVTHHDTKISNVLFDEANKGLCVIDLDTVMPGYFISDVGDMFRTYLSAANEEEVDLSKIAIRKPIFEAIVNGYLSEMGEELTEVEKQSFDFAGKYMIYMQAIRFLTDYLNNDIYYGCKYPTHNLVRASNQGALLKKFIDFTNHLN